MKLHSHIVVLLILCMSVSQLSAQTADALINKANKKYKELDFQEAIDLYEQALKKETKPAALFALPNCYRKIGNYLKAGQWYAKAAEHPEAPSEIFYYYGLSLMANDKFEEAESQFTKFREMESAQLRGHNMLIACKPEVHKDLLNAGALYDVEVVPNINTPYDDFGAVFFGKGVLFSSDRDTTKVSSYRGSWLYKPFIQSYFITATMKDKDTKEFQYGIPSLFSNELNMNYHDGPIRLDGIQQTAYYTVYGTNDKKSNRRANILNTQIASSKRVGEQWTKPNLKLGINSREYSVAHPSVTPDGDKMFFASDIPGGFGGFDLYVSYNENGEWSKPMNLGPEINTEGDEVYPFFGLDENLYFSSDGQTGIGGFDIYYSNQTGGRWSPVTNLGAPLNSEKDEISYIMDSSGTYGYFASNRVPKRKMDIYYFKRVALESQILVFDKSTGQGVAGVEIQSECLPKNQKWVTNIDGLIYAPLPLERNCKLMLTSEQFTDTEKDISTVGYVPGSELFINVPLKLKEAEFKVEGVIKKAYNNEPIIDATITLINGCGEEQVVIPISHDGRYSMTLSKDCSYVLKVEREGFFTNTQTFSTKGLRLSKTFTKNIAMPKSTGSF
ncbi:flagellar motor protein MotB [Aureispira anguillae]|uniref:Flagellar motor protein MotB n=1 Tax=Aureispira anguillae TaxID=2864201 RepID=A0A915YIY2_9BACT|nr:flagellar motor protein MotB [Aureispira anguillae]BDS14057.1 flagellar motor protein MotB [Aureispira anguillae]